MRWLALLLLAACEPIDGGPGTVTDAECADAPATTWDNFGAGFVTQNCQGCHASTAVNRLGAPDDVVFDTEEDTLRWADRILDLAASEAPTMPPRGGVSDDDRYRVRVWLGCGG